MRHPEPLLALAEEFCDYARRGGQVFVSTHSPEFLNATRPEEVYWRVKRNGFAVAKRAVESELLRNLVAVGDLPGALWRQGPLRGSGATVSLEAWYLGEPEALAAASNDEGLADIGGMARFRDPDTVAQPATALEQLVPRFQKVSRARRIALHLTADRNRSTSYRFFLEGVRRVGAPCMEADGP